MFAHIAFAFESKHLKYAILNDHHPGNPTFNSDRRDFVCCARSSFASSWRPTIGEAWAGRLMSQKNQNRPGSAGVVAGGCEERCSVGGIRDENREVKIPPSS